MKGLSLFCKKKEQIRKRADPGQTMSDCVQEPQKFNEVGSLFFFFFFLTCKNISIYEIKNFIHHGKLYLLGKEKISFKNTGLLSKSRLQKSWLTACFPRIQLVLKVAIQNSSLIRSTKIIGLNQYHGF